MGLKRKLKRLRYNCSWRYPRLFQLAQRLYFPAQVATLCLTLYAVVAFYQKHYSFEATMRANTPLTTAPKPAPMTLDTNVSLGAAKAGPHTNASNVIQVSRQTNEKEPLVLVPGSQIVDSQTEGTRSSPQTSITELLNSDWILNQNYTSFVIQIATSDNQTELRKYAQELPLLSPLAMYPFRQTNAGKLTYGLSAGLYNSSSEALNALDTLPQSAKQYGTWVRNVAVIGAQISALDLDPL